MYKQRLKIKDLLSSYERNVVVDATGWIRQSRGNKQTMFITLNDGSCVHSIQVVIEKKYFDSLFLKNLTTGTAVKVTGLLVNSLGEEQNLEIVARNIHIYGTCDPQDYPIQKKGHSLEYLRDVAHLRLRTNIFGCVFRIRHHLAISIHKYFHDKGFFYFHTPIITASDAEGAGAMFRVTTLTPEDMKKDSFSYQNDFFGRSTNLTVSGQLEGELGALSLGAIYTFSPTFRAENSNTSRHLAEFWMIEPEVAFNDLNDNMDLAEDLLKYLMKDTLESCIEDVKYLNNSIDNKLIERINMIINCKFVRLTYTDSINILEKVSSRFEYPILWGMDLKSEHERYLVERYFKCPVIITDYPKEIKPFYMKVNDDDKTVKAMDVLFPRVGEIIGGSEREENYQKLMYRAENMDIPIDSINWYLDSRKFGTAPHSGFGLGFERLVLFATGLTNIRDVIPFPRVPKNAEF